MSAKMPTFATDLRNNKKKHLNDYEKYSNYYGCSGLYGYRRDGAVCNVQVFQL